MKNWLKKTIRVLKRIGHTTADINAVRQTAQWVNNFCDIEKQPFRGVFSKTCSENMLQIYRRTPMAKCDCEATLWKSHFSMGVLL